MEVSDADGGWCFLLMECPVDGGLDVRRFAHGVWNAAVLGQVKPSKIHCRASGQLGLSAFTALFWTLHVYCPYGVGVAGTTAYEVPPAGSAWGVRQVANTLAGCVCLLF